MGTDKGSLDRPVEWRSSDPNVVSVDERGRVRGLAPGSAYLTASAAGQCKSVLLDVSARRTVRTFMYLGGTAAVLAAVGLSASRLPGPPIDAGRGWTTGRPVAPIIAPTPALPADTTDVTVAGDMELTLGPAEVAPAPGSQPGAPASVPVAAASTAGSEDPSTLRSPVNGRSPPVNAGADVAEISGGGTAVVVPSGTSVPPAQSVVATDSVAGAGAQSPPTGADVEGLSGASGADGAGVSPPSARSAPSAETSLAIASLRSAEARSAAGDYDASLLFYLAADNRLGQLDREFSADSQIRMLRDEFQRSLEGTLRACNALRRSDASRGALSFECTYPPGNGDG